MPRLHILSLLPFLIAGTLTMAGCAGDGAGQDSGWRPVQQQERFMTFAANRFDLKPVTYARKRLSFNHALDYGQWRATGDSERTVRLMFENLRADAYLVFTTNSREPLPADIEAIADEGEAIRFEAPFTYQTSLGEVEFVRFATDATSCLGLRWYEGDVDQEAGLLGTGQSLGTQAMTGYRCERAGHRFEDADAEAFASSISIRGFRRSAKPY